MPTKVLVIDDDPATTELLCLILNTKGFEVLVANNGEQGLDIIKEQIPDVIILDLMMPEMNGWQVCRTIRAISSIPILIFSALDNPESITSALDAGADDYLVKPVPISVLIARLNNVARRAVTSEASPTINKQLNQVSTTR